MRWRLDPIPGENRMSSVLKDGKKWNVLDNGRCVGSNRLPVRAAWTDRQRLDRHCDHDPERERRTNREWQNDGDVVGQRTRCTDRRARERDGTGHHG